VAGASVDLVVHFARPLPIDVIAALVGIPEADRAAWRGYGVAVAAGHGRAFGEAIPAIIADATAAVAARTVAPPKSAAPGAGPAAGEDLLSILIGAAAEDGDRLTPTELITLVWHLVLAGQTPANLIANAVAALLDHPAERAALAADPALLTGAVEELTRFCGPQLLSLPRQARTDTELHGVPVAKGEAVCAVLAAANRDPRVFDRPDRLDVRRPAGPAGHLGYAHGPHFCLGAALSRVQTEVALGRLLARFPDLAAAGTGAQRVPDPATWRLAALPVTLGPSQPTGSGA